MRARARTEIKKIFENEPGQFITIQLQIENINRQMSEELLLNDRQGNLIQGL